MNKKIAVTIAGLSMIPVFVAAPATPAHASYSPYSVETLKAMSLAKECGSNYVLWGNPSQNSYIGNGKELAVYFIPNTTKTCALYINLTGKASPMTLKIYQNNHVIYRDAGYYNAYAGPGYADIAKDTVLWMVRPAIVK